MCTIGTIGRLRGQRVLLALLVSMILHVVPASAQDAKIGFIRSATILEQYSGARAALESFNRDVEAWNQEAQARRREIDQIGRELEAQSPMLTDQVRQDKEQEYQRKLNEYDQYVQSIWGPEGLVAQRNEEAMRGVVDKIQRAARKIAAEDGYDYILDASEGNIIYADAKHDLTRRVIEALNQPE